MESSIEISFNNGEHTTFSADHTYITGERIIISRNGMPDVQIARDSAEIITIGKVPR